MQLQPDTTTIDENPQSKVLMTASKQHKDGSNDIGCHTLSLAELDKKDTKQRSEKRITLGMIQEEIGSKLFTRS